MEAAGCVSVSVGSPASGNAAQPAAANARAAEYILEYFRAVAASPSTTAAEFVRSMQHSWRASADGPSADALALDEPQGGAGEGVAAMALARAEAASKAARAGAAGSAQEARAALSPARGPCHALMPCSFANHQLRPIQPITPQSLHWLPSPLPLEPFLTLPNLLGTHYSKATPAWKPADWLVSSGCAICTKQFTMIRRRHHCRACGRSVWSVLPSPALSTAAVCICVLLQRVWPCCDGAAPLPLTTCARMSQ